MSKTYVFFLTLLTFGGLHARAGFSNDPHVQTVLYADGKLVSIIGSPGFHFDIRLADYEQITRVVLGNASEWVVDRNVAGNAVSIKPVQQGAMTNLTIETTVADPSGCLSPESRHYMFELSAQDSAKQRLPRVYLVAFRYPADENKLDGCKSPRSPVGATTPHFDPKDFNANFKLPFDSKLRPVQVFDNGRFTYFQFSDRMEEPAIFAVGVDGELTLVNTRKDGNFVVVDCVAQEFRLRLGKSEARVFNRKLAAASGTQRKKG